MKQIRPILSLALMITAATFVRAQTASVPQGQDDTIHFHVGKHHSDDAETTPSPSPAPENSSSTDTRTIPPKSEDHPAPDTTKKSDPDNDKGSAVPTTPEPPSPPKQPAMATASQFQADVTTETQGMSFDAHISIDGGNVRSDMSMMGMTTSVVVNSKEKQFFQLIPQNNTLVKLPWSDDLANTLSPSSLNGATWSRSPKSESVDDVKCDVWTVQEPSGQMLNVDINAKSGDPVKVTAQDGSFTVLWKNYKQGPADPKIFKKPGGYTEVDAPDNMKNMNPSQLGLRLW